MLVCFSARRQEEVFVFDLLMPKECCCNIKKSLGAENLFPFLFLALASVKESLRAGGRVSRKEEETPG